MDVTEAHTLIDRVLALRTEGELSVWVDAQRRLGTRFSDCAVSQNSLKKQITLTLKATLGQRQASLTLNSIGDDDMLQRAVKKVLHTCQHMPEDEEVMPLTGEVVITPHHAFCDDTDSLDIETIGDWVGQACAKGKASGVDLAGLLSVKKALIAYGDSAGGRAAEAFTRCDYHVTATGEQGSGWAEHQGVSVTLDQLLAATGRAVDKCVMAQNPQVFEPREVTVILEPQAVGDLLGSGFMHFDQRATDEGRSPFSAGLSKMGSLNLVSDPANEVFPALSFTGMGEPLEKTTWLDKGVPQQLVTSRYWAKHKNTQQKLHPNNLILEGQGSSLDDMIQSTKDGILVTRFWYIRVIDAGTMAYTGMTRNGVFRIENGQITHPVVDMRWNESVIRVLENVVDSGVPTATGEWMNMVMPALKIENFRFTSLSNA